MSTGLFRRINLKSLGQTFLSLFTKAPVIPFYHFRKRTRSKNQVVQWSVHLIIEKWSSGSHNDSSFLTISIASTCEVVTDAAAHCPWLIVSHKVGLCKQATRAKSLTIIRGRLEVFRHHKFHNVSWLMWMMAVH
jgi:hypothetical protein